MVTKAQQRQLDAEWQKLLKSHSKPLERGHKAKGGGSILVLPTESQSPFTRPTERPKSLGTFGAATVPVIDPLKSAKDNLKSRTGQLYNKGGIQYLTDADMLEQKTGSHKRR